MPTALLRDPTISPQAKALYAVIRSYADFGKAEGAYPSQGTICGAMAIGVTTLRRLRGELKAAGWMAWKLLKTTSGDVRRTDYICKDLAPPSLHQREEVPAPVAGGVLPSVVGNRETSNQEPLDREKSKALVALTRDGIVADLKSLFTQQHVNGGLREAKAKLVFAYWAAKWDHGNAVYDAKRQAQLLARLRENADDVSELLWVIDGAKRDDWPDRRRYAGIEQLFRDRGAVEKFASLAPGYQRQEYHPMAEKFCPKANGHAVG